MIFKKFYGFCLVATLLIFGSTVSANEMTSDEVEKQFQSALESVDSYVNWMEEQILIGQAVPEQLETFNSLSSVEQEAFIKILKNQNTYFAPITEEEQFNVKSLMDSNQNNGSKTIKIEVDGVTLPLTIEQGNYETTIMPFSTARTITSNYTLSLGGTTITSFSTWARYEHGTTNATRF